MTDSLATMIESAARLGAIDANYDAAYGFPHDAPLSGEWSGDRTPFSLACDLGYMGDDSEIVAALADAYEAAYFERVLEEWED